MRARSRSWSGYAVALLLLVVAGAPAQAGSDEAVARGKKVYNQICASCHGRYGRGDGPIAPNLVARPPDLTNPKVLGGRSDEQILARIGGGKGARHTPMAVAQALQPEAMRDAIDYMRTLSVAGGNASVLAGRDIFNSFCWICHGRDGKGDGPAAANLPGNKPRNFTDPKFKIAGREDEIYQTISKGAMATIHGSQYMLEWGSKLQPQQIRDVIAYLKTFQKAGAAH
jgi:mono/diheme cytochrome c family protein